MIPHCFKNFKTQYNLNRHLQNSCLNMKKDIQSFHTEEILLHIKKLEDENKILHNKIINLNEKFQNKILEENEFLKNQLNKTKVSSINYIQNNFINAFTIQDLNKSLQITYKDLQDTSAYGYANGIANIIYNHYIKDVPFEKRSFHCLDIPRKIFVYHLEKIGWVRDNKQLEDIIRLVHNLLLKRINDYKMEEIKKLDNGTHYNECIGKYDCLLPSNLLNEEQTKSEFEKESNKIIRNISQKASFNITKPMIENDKTIKN